MHRVGPEILEHALVVRDQQEAEVGTILADLFDPGRDLAERVDVETRVGLVEHRHHGLQHRHLQHLVALLLAPGEPLVEVALLEAGVHAEAGGPLHELHPHLEHRVVVDALPLGDRLPQEVEHRDARDLLRVLEAEEQAERGAVLDRQVGDVGAGHVDTALRDLVGGVAEQRVGQRRLPGAVGSHQGVELPGLDREVDAPQDLPAFDGDVEVFDQERGRGDLLGHGGHSNNTTAVVEIQV